MITIHLMPDDGRWAYWTEHVTDEISISLVQKGLWRIKYTSAATKEEREVDVIAFQLGDDDSFKKMIPEGVL